MEFSRVAVRLGGGEAESKLETIRKPKEVPLHICIIHVCKKKIHRIHPMENETNESLWRLNTLFGFDEMIERGQTFCEAIGAVPGSNPLNVHNSILMTRES